MTYEKWCKHSTAILAEAKKHNEWADKAKDHLLKNIGPRIAKLGHVMYMGCGFHYSMEQTFGKLIVSMSVSWQPSANWCKNVEDDRMKHLTTKVCYDMLLKQIRKAERSAKIYAQKENHSKTRNQTQKRRSIPNR